MPAAPYRVLVISVSDDDKLVRQIQINQLPEHWRTIFAYPQLQKIGDNWYDRQESLMLKVPSVIIPHEYNYVINAEHPDYAANVQLVRDEDYFFDPRLFR